MPLSERRRAELERQREALRTWIIEVKLPSDVLNPGRYMARVKCVALRDGLPAEKVTS